MRLAALVVFATIALSDAAAAQSHVAPADAPARAAIAGASEPGTRMTVSGRVVDLSGKPVPGASIYAYQTDAKGEYIAGGTGAQGSDRPRLFAYMRSDEQGRYSFTTIRPGSYPQSRNPGHIHFEINAPGHEERIYEIVFEGDPYISEQFRAQARNPLGGVAIVSVRTNGAAQEVSHDIRIAPAR